MADAEKKPTRPEEPMRAPRSEPREVFTIRNLARDPESRTARRLRPGNYTGFVLGDGRRVRRAGARGTELSFKDVYEHREQILEGVRLKEIEVSLNGEVGTYEMLKNFMGAYERHEGHKKTDLSQAEKKRIEKESGLGDDNPSQLPSAGATADELRAKLAAEQAATEKAAEDERIRKAQEEEDARLAAELEKAAAEAKAATPPDSGDDVLMPETKSEKPAAPAPSEKKAPTGKKR